MYVCMHAYVHVCMYACLCTEEVGGTSLIDMLEHALTDGLTIPDKAGFIYIDMHGYDGWLAEAGHLHARACVFVCMWVKSCTIPK